MALYASVKELLRDPEHFLLMVVTGDAVEGLKHLMKFTVPLYKLVDPGGVFGEHHRPRMDPFMGLFHGAVQRRHGFLHFFRISEGDSGHDIAEHAVQGQHFLDKRIRRCCSWRGRRVAGVIIMPCTDECREPCKQKKGDKKSNSTTYTVHKVLPIECDSSPWHLLGVIPGVFFLSIT